MSELNGKAIISEELLSRPRSIEEGKGGMEMGPLKVGPERRKKSSLSGKKSEGNRRGQMGNGNAIKF